MNDSPLNRKNAPSIIRLFDVCLKRGVLDAAGARDDYSVREFILEHKKLFKFGTISEPVGHDWRSYRFVLYRWARENSLTSLAENYIMEIRRQNYVWCLLPYCLWFYIMGAEEWLEYPNASSIEMFKVNGRIHWNPAVVTRQITKMDYISYMHEAAFAYKAMDAEDKLVSDSCIDGFCSAVYDLTRKYATRGK